MTKIYIKTFGCSVNQSDSEVMAGLLEKAEFDIVDNEDDAELIIINTCVVKLPTENKVMKYIEDIGKTKKTIISGCITKTEPGKLIKYSLISPKQISNIIEVVEETLQGHIVHLIADDKNPRLNLPKIRKSKAIEIIPICAGCLGNCAYCIVKKARGHLISYNPEAILKQAKQAVIKDKVKEIWITAQDTGAYGYDISSESLEQSQSKFLLPKLLKQLITIPGDFKIRLGMINPNHTLKLIDELIDIYKNNKMFKFIHIPIQSGNNEILEKMNRKYTVEQFKEIITKLRKAVPDITIATDIICGFPSETKEQFEDTINLVKWLNPDIINISKYWERPGTKAYKMENKIQSLEIKQRSAQLSTLFKNIGLMVNERWYNWTGDIIIDEIGKGIDEEASFIGRNYAYKPVIVKGNYELGQVIRVRVNKMTSFHLKGEEVRSISI